jgi:hypothetical protein
LNLKTAIQTAKYAEYAKVKDLRQRSGRNRKQQERTEETEIRFCASVFSVHSCSTLKRTWAGLAVMTRAAENRSRDIIRQPIAQGTS